MVKLMVIIIKVGCWIKSLGFLKGTPVIVETASWDNGLTEDRFWVSDITSIEYNQWREMMLGDIVDGEHEYSYTEGTSP